MAFDFPNSPTLGQAYGNYLWDGEKWTLPNLVDPVAARKSVYAAPFDALAYSGMQINGSMEVSQEKGANGTAVNATYICDGWRLHFSGTMAVAAAQGGSITPGFPSSFNFAVQTAQASLGANDFACFVHPVEGFRVARLGWGTANAQPITIGFWSSHFRAGIYGGSIRNGAGTRCYAFNYTQAVSNTPQYNTITIPGCTDGAWTADNTVGLSVTLAAAAGSTVTAPSANSWLVGSYFTAPGQVNAVAATTDVLRFTGVVILPGIEAPSAARSPLIMRPFDQELVTCQRYYENLYSGPGGIILPSWQSGTGFYSNWSFHTKKRSVPTITYPNGIWQVASPTSTDATIDGVTYAHGSSRFYMGTAPVASIGAAADARL